MIGGLLNTSLRTGMNANIPDRLLCRKAFRLGSSIRRVIAFLPLASAVRNALTMTVGMALKKTFANMLNSVSFLPLLAEAPRGF
jgi:hypothetical protein